MASMTQSSDDVVLVTKEDLMQRFDIAEETVRQLLIKAEAIRIPNRFNKAVAKFQIRKDIFEELEEYLLSDEYLKLKSTARKNLEKANAIKKKAKR
jgi:hypothetical protein